MKKVAKFNVCVQIYPMIVWKFAYHASRQGPWEQFARDRERFRRRILRYSLIISPILKNKIMCVNKYYEK